MPDKAAAESQSEETSVSKPKTTKAKKPKAPTKAKVAPAQEIEDLGAVKLDELEVGSPQWYTKKKILREEALRKKKTGVKDSWLEYHHTNANEKGGKVLMKKRLENGNVHSFYLGRLEKGGRQAIQAYGLKGVELRVGAEHFKDKKKG